MDNERRYGNSMVFPKTIRYTTNGEHTVIPFRLQTIDRNVDMNVFFFPKQ